MRTQEHYYQTFLKEELASRMKSNSRYSLRAFAKSLSVDPSTLSRILTGQKKITPALSNKVISNLQLSPSEANKFLRSMAEAYETEDVKRKKKEVKDILSKPRFNFNELDLNAETFAVISAWYHYAILQLIETDSFKPDTKWMARELGILESEARLAIERMLELNLIREEKGRLIRTSERLTSGDLTKTTTALRARMKQITEKSNESLEKDPLSKRNHTTLTMAIDPDQIPMAKEMIQDFMDLLGSTLQKKKKRVYELQINLFPLQRENK